jgi:SAM-dependent methyltransferase
MELHFSERRCPGCDSTRGREVLPQRIDAAALDEYAFASRKFPEYMHHRLVECAVCDLLYADPVLALDELGGIYDAAAFDSKEEAECASRTYAGLAHSLRGKLPHSEAALDIGTGEGSFLERLLDLGFGRVRGYEPSAAPLAAASPRVRELIVHDVFRPGGPGGGPFDLVTCFQTIEHVPDPALLCRDVLELLRPGGAFLIVCHDRRAPLNRALGRRSPIIDIEHLQLFSQESARALMQRAGFGGVDVRRITNRYPLHYWLKLAPLPRRVKQALVSGTRREPLRGLSLSLPVGNLAVTGFRAS